MKKFFNLLKYLALIFISVVVLLFAIAEFAEDRIASISVEQINKSIGLPVTYDEISFSLLRDFPLATLEINDIWLGSPSKGESKNKIDTLANIQKVYVSVRMLPLVSEQRFDIVEIDVEGAEGFYAVDSSGISNIDFLMDTTHTEAVDTTATGLQISLRELTIKNMRLQYSDKTINAKGLLSVPEIYMDGEFENGIFESAIEGTAILSDCHYGETNACLMKQTKLVFEMEYLKDSVFINKAHVFSDGIELRAEGEIGLKEDLFSSLLISSPSLDIQELKKYIPIELLEEYGIENTSGTAKLEGTVKGVISDSIMPGLSFDFEISKGGIKIKDYPALSNIKLNGQFTNGSLHNNQSTSLSINQLYFETDQSNGELDFILQDLDNPRYSGSFSANMDLKELKNHFIPDSLISKLEGKMDARLVTEGVLPDKIDSTFMDKIAQNSRGFLFFKEVNLTMDSLISVDSCDLEIEYLPDTLRIKDANLRIPSYHVMINDADAYFSFSGQISDYMNMAVKMDTLHLQTTKSLISGSASLSNLNEPDYELYAKMDLDMGEIAKMVPDTLIMSMNGEIMASMSSSGKIRPDSMMNDIEPLIFENSSFIVNANNFSVRMPDTLMSVKNLTGEFSMAHDSLKIINTSGTYANIDFMVDSTSVTNSYGAILQKDSSPLGISGKFALGDLDYSAFAAFMEEDSLGSDKISGENTPDNEEFLNFKYNLKGTLSVNSFKYNKSTFENLSCLFNLSDSLFIIDQFKTDAFDGTLNNAIRYELYPDNRSVVAFRSQIDKMDISTLLKEFDDFDQKEISHEQLSGLFSTKMDGRIVMHGDSLVMDSIQVKGDMKLEDGGLYNYKRAMELADFTSLDELDNMQFKTMESQLFIFKNALYVPKTDIRSNAMDITAYGMQTFGEDYQYHLRIYLGEILHGKTRRIRKKQEEMADNPDDKKPKLKSLYIQSSSINGNSKNGLDNKKDRFRMQTKINVQEKILNIIFHPLLLDFDTGVDMEMLQINRNMAKK
ncbi:AsmA family protein [Marinilabilia rubra]|uniref:Uncharacterized protein n=1 Tax=Marinilabilia rubra TaxID=2162893 RepID=A0A2U2BAR4_9BACT|nr:AsmA-like C-terminal region-containing protein [Marinilabilia rubra]PWE00133.1 hypothetical protein DDZ16_07180 [Marinilabilia rubra]